MDSTEEKQPLAAAGLQQSQVRNNQARNPSKKTMQCKRCARTFQREDWVSSISGSIMGDEHTDSYFLCPACGLYTVAVVWDNFTGVETTSESGPLSKQEGDERVNLIRQCSQPWDKKCRCPAHLEYFKNTLD